MDHPPKFGVGKDTTDSNPMFVEATSPHATKETKSSPSKPRWLKHFQLCQNTANSASNPKSYTARSREGHKFPPLSAVDSTAGQGECKAQTAKQWDTIIENAKICDKVPGDMKAAKFIHFGYVVRDPKPAKPTLAYSFERRLSEVESDKEMKKLPLPLGDYDVKRRLKTILRRRARPATLESEHISFPSSFSSSSGTPVSEHEDSFTEAFQTPVDTHMLGSANEPKKAKIGLDLSYLKYAAEEHFNDYELVKGLGKVPINQKAPDPIVPVDGPWNLSPGAWALKDFRYPLQKMISSDLTINNLMILPSISLPTLDNDGSLQFRWDGATEQTITVFKDHDIKSFAFKDVTIIKYNQKEYKLFFEFSSTDPYKLEELLLILLPVPDQTWLTLQTCCYSLVKGQKSKQRCDYGDRGFFEDKAKALMNLRIKRPPVIPFPNRHMQQAASRGQNVGHRSRKPSIPLSQTRLSTPTNTPTNTPTKASNAASGRNSTAVNLSHGANVSKDTTPRAVIAPHKPELYGNEEAEVSASGHITSNSAAFQEMPQNSDDTESDSEIFEDFPATVNGERVEDLKERTDGLSIGGGIEPKCDNRSPAGLFYRSTLRSEAPIPVRLNDLVVRLRSESEREKGGRRDKLDIFDGPWRIVEFGKPKSTYNVNSLSHQDNGDGNASPSAYQYDRTKAKKMLKTKVRLGFPRETRANCWVELNLLLPMTKMENVCNGKLHASSWPITEFTAFKELYSEMESRNLEAFDAKYLSLTMKKLEEDLNTAGEQTREAEDVMTDEVNKDESEIEDLPMHIVEIKAGIFVAIMEADPKAVDDGDSYLVEKLRAKRLRLFKLNSPQVQKQKLTTDHEDPWVKRLLREMPHFATNRIVVSEYKVHWAGWADEDDTWDLGTGNIAKGFIDEFNLLTDIMRTLSFEARMADPRDMILKDDLPKAPKIRTSIGSSRSVASSAATSVVKNQGGRRTEEDQDSEMIDAEEDLAISKAIQASLDEVKAAKTYMALEALQREMGVVPKDMEANDISQNEAGRRSIDSTTHQESEMGGINDAFMAEGDELEEAEGYSEEGDHGDGDEE